MDVERLSIESYLDSDRHVTDFTNNGVCSQCGGCCTDLLYISEKETKTIRRYIERHNITEHTNKSALDTSHAIDVTCPFLTDDGKCQIYEVRPSICKLFKCDMSENEIMQNQNRYKARFKLQSMRDLFFQP